MGIAREHMTAPQIVELPPFDFGSDPILDAAVAGLANKLKVRFGEPGTVVEWSIRAESPPVDKVCEGGYQVRQGTRVVIQFDWS